MELRSIFTAANIAKFLFCIFLLFSPLLLRYSVRCTATDPFAITAGIDREIALSGDSIRWCFYPQSAELLRAVNTVKPSADSFEAAFFSLFIRASSDISPEKLASDAARIFVILSLMAGLSSVAVFLIAWNMKQSFFYSTSASLLYVFSPAYIAAGGADFSHSFFFMFFFSFFCLFLVYCFKKRASLWTLIAVALFFYASLSAWAGASIIFAVAGIWEFWRIFNGAPLNSRRKKLYISLVLVFLFAACFPLCPEQRELIHSPLIILLPALVAALFTGSLGRLLKRFILASLLVLMSFVWISTSFSSNTFAGESARLMVQKIKCTSIKPGKPDRINPEARILWNGELNSIEVATYKTHFPAAMTVFLFLFAALPAFSPFWKRMKKSSPCFGFLYFSLFASLFLYAFFNVYAGLASFILAILLPVFLDQMSLRDMLKTEVLRYSAMTLMLVTLTLEIWGSVQISYPELSSYRNIYACGKMLNDSICKSEVFVADAPLASIMRDSFDLRMKDVFSVQKRYEFIESVFFKNEAELNKMLLGDNVKILLINKRGFFEFAKNSPRYIASVTKIADASLADLLSTSRDAELTWFVKLELPPQYAFLDKDYVCLRLLRPSDRIAAVRKDAEAEAALAAGERAKAAQLIKEAVLLYPHIMKSSSLYYKLYGKYPIPTLSGIE